MKRTLKGVSDEFEVAASPIHGWGLRSLRERRGGETLYAVRGRSVSMPFDDDYGYAPNWIGIGWESWLVPERGNPIRFTNHGCEPNAIVSEGLAVVALQDIPPGGEVLLDYATTEVDPHWRLHCRCGTPQCRGEVRSFPFLSQSLQVRYEPYLPDAFLAAARRVAGNPPVPDEEPI